MVPSTHPHQVIKEWSLKSQEITVELWTRIFLIVTKNTNSKTSKCAKINVYKVCIAHILYTVSNNHMTTEECTCLTA